MAEVIYMSPLEPGVILMTPLEPDVIYMSKVNEPLPAAEYEWRLINLYTFPGNSCSASWNSTAGNYTGASRVITTKAVRVRVIGVSGYWYDGTHYRGMMDAKTSDHYQHVGYDWTGTFWGFVAAGNAAAYWATVTDEMDIGPDGTFAWGGYDLNPADNTGALTFALYGKFHR